MAMQGGFSGHTAPNYQQALYAQLLPTARQLLEVMLESDFEDSIHAVASFVLGFRYHDSDISAFMQHGEVVMKARMLEAVAWWIRGKGRELDQLVPATQVAAGYVAPIKERLKEECDYQQGHNRVLAEFVNSAVLELLGREAACLANALGGALLHEVDNEQLLLMTAWPSLLLALMVRKLEEMQAKISKVIMELFHSAQFMSYDDSKNLLRAFFQHYTIDTLQGTLEVHATCDDQAFVDSSFRVNLVDSFGSLMRLLQHLEQMIYQRDGYGQNGFEPVLAVDFEGVKLCRHGALCLVQMTCSDDPRQVYVLDVHVLGRRAFSMQTPNGTCMRGVLEDENVRKVWFDPRNDVDALYHQFGIMPRGIFDLQLAEVADRRNRGLNVHYVQGLHKCLTQCPTLQNEQKSFADLINRMGKELFEPQHGGNYEIFQRRPLHPVILVYAAHDSRYMLVLYQQYLAAIGPRWVQRVIQAGDQRGRWCLSREYALPNSEAPEF